MHFRFSAIHPGRIFPFSSDVKIVADKRKTLYFHGPDCFRTAVVQFRCFLRALASLLMSPRDSGVSPPLAVWMWQFHMLEWCMESAGKWDGIISVVAALWIWIDLSDIHLHLPSVFQHNAENYLSATLSVPTAEELDNSGFSQVLTETCQKGMGCTKNINFIRGAG